MKKAFLLSTLSLCLCLCLGGCTPFTKVQKSSNREYKYEMAKAYFIEGKYSNAQTLLEELIAFLKGSATGEESLYMLALCYYNQKDYVTAAQYLQTYCSTYPKGLYSEEARFHTVKALFLDTPDPRLDQSSTIRAISEIEVFLEFYPRSAYKPEVQRLLYVLQDRLVEKEYRSALLYYDLGNYMGNNYQACIITSQNALHDYPYTKFREDLSFLILKAKYSMAKESVKEKMLDRYRDTVDEYYAFKNEFPESTRMKDADKILSESQKAIKKL
ncbi:MAG: outer membrane protein assembly factor BamD [Bacteroidaceae bacterium]|nr:outer membrane protein assembly factor BamD [Bacteroidaceae bacterium]